MSKKLAVALIVKGTDDEAPLLEKCLKSVHKHVDGIFLNVNHKEGAEASRSVLDVARAYTENIIVTRWNDDFAEARNANFEQVPAEYDYILWLDSDDTVDHPEKAKALIEESDKFDCIYVDYLYDRDEEGNPLTVHMVGRLVKNNGGHKWKGRIHETLIETRSVLQGATKDFTIIHNADEERKDRSLDRNIKLLEKQLMDEAAEPDPRTFYYLASTYMDGGDPESAKGLFDDYLQLSGWDQERAAAHTKLGRIYFQEGKRAEAKNHFMQAIGEDPTDPEPRVEMGSLELDLKQYAKAVHWLEGVTKMEKSMSTLERNPMSYTFRTYLLLADAYLNMGGVYLKEAAHYAKKARSYKKQNKEVVEYTKMIEQLYADKNELEGIVRKYKELKETGKKKKAARLLENIPEHLADNVVIATLRKENNPFTWPQKSIAIMTGDTALDAWGPWSLEEGIGGSEEAVIRLSRQLSKLGWKVVVFAKPGIKTGIDDDGVMWRNYWDCNLEDTFDVFVAWRAPFIFENKIKARKSYLWLHDVMEPGEFTPDRIANFTKCIVLSDYHRSLFPMIPDEKILLSANGIDPEEFEKLDGTIERDPHKVLYTSSHVRGLAYLYDVWEDVKKAVPDATLDVYYGRQSYDAVHKGNPERMKWMDDLMTQAESLDGVTDHGRASQQHVMEEAFRSGIWAYPCLWPEIYCIAAIKNQAGGAIPVATDFAAINETVQYGSKIHGEDGGYNEAFLTEYKEKLIWWLQHPEEQEKIRIKMQKWARTNSWLAVAEQWSSEFTS
jgi:glycosyltransferase involved in cell wall biosynthesis